MSGNPTNSNVQKFQVNYYSKIGIISTYFGVSDSAAKYIYHLRRKGSPFKKPDKQDYLNWTIPLQNALVLADTHESFNWNTLQFGDELNALTRHGIDVNDRDQRIFRNDVDQGNAVRITTRTNVNIENDGGGWTVVGSKYQSITEKYILRNCGLLPIRTRKTRVKKKNIPGNGINLSECTKSNVN
jgi:hypothetical protein